MRNKTGFIGQPKQSFALARNLFFCEWAQLRTVMGFLLGMVMPFYWLHDFLQYAADYGEPVNVLEAFIVIVQAPRGILLFVLGWLIIAADAPFANGHTYFSLCRTSYRTWNGAASFYMAGQSLLYVLGMALPMVAKSAFYGFIGRMWSSPVYALAKNIGAGYSEEYHVVFDRIGMMRGMDVFEAFFVTALCLWLYLFALGQLLYTFNLLFRSMTGMAGALFIHVGGYLAAWGQYRGFSLTACAVAADYVDDGGMDIQPIVKLAGFIVFCMLLQAAAIKKADFLRESSENR